MFKPSSYCLADRSKDDASFVEFFMFHVCLCNANCFLFLQSCDYLLVKSRPIGSFVCCVYFCFITIYSKQSIEILDNID